MKHLRTIPEVKELKARVLISGFHGIGATGYWTVRFLIKELSAQRICFIDYKDAPAISFISSGRISTPYEVYMKDDVCFFKSEIMPSREKENSFYRGFARWVINTGISEVALVGGLDESLRVDDSKYRIALTSKMIERKELSNEPMLEEDRIIVGPVATLLNYFEMHDFPAFAVLAYSSTERIDPRAAANAVEFLSKRYGFSVDTSPLIKGAEELESEIREIEQKERKPSSSVYS